MASLSAAAVGRGSIVGVGVGGGSAVTVAASCPLSVVSLVGATPAALAGAAAGSAAVVGVAVGVGVGSARPPRLQAVRISKQQAKTRTKKTEKALRFIGQFGMIQGLFCRTIRQDILTV